MCVNDPMNETQQAEGTFYMHHLSGMKIRVGGGGQRSEHHIYFEHKSLKKNELTNKAAKRP